MSLIEHLIQHIPLSFFLSEFSGAFEVFKGELDQNKTWTENILKNTIGKDIIAV